MGLIRQGRAGALLAAGLVAAQATGLALAEPAGGPGLADAPPLFQLAGVAAEARPRPAPPRAVFPVTGGVGYGQGGARYGADRGGRMHEGQDVFAPAGTPLVALAAGRVVETGNDGGRGNYVAVYSPRLGRTWLYLHMQSPARHGVGERVRAGERVGEVGCTGSCFGDHLHLELRDGQGTSGAPRDPLPLLEKLRAR